MRYDVPCGRWCGTGFPRLGHTFTALGENARAHLTALLALRLEQRNADTQSLFICLTDEDISSDPGLFEGVRHMRFIKAARCHRIAV